jgi:rhodanese-related sulfurtransferase
MAIRHTTPEEVDRLIGIGYRYIDVRTEPEFAAGHPINAVSIPAEHAYASLRGTVS